MATLSDVRDAFDEMGVDIGKGLESQCVSLAVQFNSSAADLASAFLSFMYSRGDNDFEVTAAALEPFRAFLAGGNGKVTQGKSSSKTPLKDATNSPYHVYGRDDLDLVNVVEPAALIAAATPGARKGGMLGTVATPRTPGGFSPATPAASSAYLAALRTPTTGVSTPGSSSWKSPAATFAFAQRPSKCQVVQVALGGELSRVVPADAMQVDGGAWRCEVAPFAEQAAAGARYMDDTLAAKAAEMERRVTAFAAAVAAQYGLDTSHPVHAAAQEKVVVVGRVVGDGDQRLSARGVTIEGSVAMCGGTRVRLELREAAAAVALFPGQVVAAEGYNPSGHCLLVTRLFTAAAAPLAPPPPAQHGDGSMSMVVAAGPFCCPEDVAYEPLKDLLAYVVAEQPDCVMLLGPFVDSEHPAVKNGSLDVTFEDLFATVVRESIEKMCEAAPATRVVLVPSTRDAHLDLVFPQPAVDVVDFETLPGQVVGAANPATLRCNDMVVGVSTHDVLKHLSAAELAVGTPAGADRMARLAAHLPAQASYYPLYPPPLGAALDTSQGARLRMAVTPHLLLLPSDLSPFAKVLPLAVAPPPSPPVAETTAPGTPGTPRALNDGAPEPMDAESTSPDAAPATTLEGSVLCVNPGRLTKGTSAGTFVHVHIHPATDGAADGAELAARTRVEVLRV